ncbi:Xaa-Pro peptidase family protein [Bacillus sp. F19]|nr:Xaa-Pro peptidase family protein [Bacillus sp. F19]
MVEKLTKAVDNVSCEFTNRIKKLQRRLQNENIDGAIFFQQEEIYYYSGTGVNSVLIVPSDQNPILLVRINYKLGKKDSYISDVRPSMGIRSIIETLKEVYAERKIVLGLSFDVININLFHNLQRNIPNASFVDVQPFVWSQRMIKSDFEIAQINMAADISIKGFDHALSILYEGMTEIQLQKLIEEVTYSYGDEGNMIQRGSNNRLSFGVVVSGENTSIISGNWMTMTGLGRSAIRPYGAGNRQISKGDLIIIDKGTIYQGYHADEARSFVLGKANDRQKNLQKILIEVLDSTIDLIRPGVLVSDIYQKAEATATSNGYKEEFMGLGQYGFKYVGHGIGLEIDEPPLISAFNHTALKPGMVLAIEPKFIFPNEFGLTMEESVLVTDSGYEILTKFPRDRFEV